MPSLKRCSPLPTISRMFLRRRKLKKALRLSSSRTYTRILRAKLMTVGKAQSCNRGPQPPTRKAIASKRAKRPRATSTTTQRSRPKDGSTRLKRSTKPSALYTEQLSSLLEPLSPPCSSEGPLEQATLVDAHNSAKQSLPIAPCLSQLRAH